MEKKGFEMLARRVITVARRPNVTKRSMSGHGSAAEMKKEVDNWKKYSIGKCDYFFCDIVDKSCEISKTKT